VNSLSIDLRRRIVARYQKGGVTYAEVAELFEVGEATVSRLLRRAREREDLHPDPIGGGFPPRIANEPLPLLVALVADKPDRTLVELCHEWRARHGTKISAASMGRSLHRAGLTRKKTFVPSEQQHARVQAQREEFLREVAQIDPNDLVFLDESGCHPSMAATHGRAPAGIRVSESKPAHWGGNITVVGAIKNDRVVGHRTFRGAMNTPRFLALLADVLCPRLHRGAVVVLDHLRVHHAPEVQQVVEAAGGRILYLPPYSPELNPLELCWSFAKTILRRLARRTESTLRKAINNTMLRVRTDHLFAWFDHCGFAQRKGAPL
jgi:transposase